MKHTPTLRHRPNKYDDWGTIRDENGENFCRVAMPDLSEEELNGHRRNGTDPTQERVDVIVRAVNAHDELVRRLAATNIAFTICLALIKDGKTRDPAIAMAKENRAFLAALRKAKD